MLSARIVVQHGDAYQIFLCNFFEILLVILLADREALDFMKNRTQLRAVSQTRQFCTDNSVHRAHSDHVVLHIHRLV